MKQSLILLRFLNVLFVLCMIAAAHAKSFPETNALRAELKITPPIDLLNGQFGSMVAAGSNYFVVGFQNLPDSDPNTPLATVYNKANNGLLLDGTLQVPGATNITIYDLSTDGDRIVFAVSEPGSTMDDAIPAIYIFRRSADEWSLQTRLLPSTNVWSISISGEAIVAGAPFKALVFELSGESWVESSLFPPADAPSAVKNGFGADVAIDNGTIVVGARGEIRSDPGRAYVYGRGTGGWELRAELLPEPFIFIPFGTVVAIEGNTILVSASMNRFSSGMVFVYECLAGTWTRTGTLQGQTQDFFGQSLAISGRNLVVGAPSAFAASGAVYLFRRNGAAYDRVTVYREDLETMNSNTGAPGAFLGNDVAAVGDTILAGAPYQDGAVVNSGVAFLFDFEFELTLESPWARAEDSSFHFAISGAKPGQTYVVQTAATPDGEWTYVKEFIAYPGDMQLEVDIPSAAMSGFFRVRTK